MLCELPSDQYRVFSGVAPLASAQHGFEPHTALVHADAATPDVAELIAEMADRTATGYLFGGLASSRGEAVQFAVGGNGNIRGHGAAGGVFRGGPVGRGLRRGRARWCRASPRAASRWRRSASSPAADGNLITELDGEPALDVLLRRPRHLAGPAPGRDGGLRATLVGLTERESDAVGRTGNFGADVVVRHIIGLDPARRGVAIADQVDAGHAHGFLPAQRPGGARRPDAHLRRDPRGAGARGTAAGGGQRAGRAARPTRRPTRRGALRAPST